MSKIKPLGLKQRVANLKKLIAESKILRFSLPLIACYQEQLIVLELEQGRDKAKRTAFYKSIKI